MRKPIDLGWQISVFGRHVPTSVLTMCIRPDVAELSPPVSTQIQGLGVEVDTIKCLCSDFEKIKGIVMKQELQFVTAVKKESQSIDFDDVRRKES